MFRIVVLSIAILGVSSCFLSRKKTLPDYVGMADSAAAMVEEMAQGGRPTYQPSRPLHWLLQHTELEVEPIYEKQELKGQARLLIKLGNVPQDSLWLDAKYMHIHAFTILNLAMPTLPPDAKNKYNHSSDTANLAETPWILDYTDSLHLKVRFAEKLPPGTALKVEIRYTARPWAVKQAGSQAITDAKGLYFINPIGLDHPKPRQVWTQGETESSSCWFPTLDAPNQKTTQEISITCDTADLTISNGELVYSTENGGKRTDKWLQSKPHAPYLAMMAIGRFAKIKDHTYDGMEVNYFVEPEYARHAKLVFGRTPAMIDFFSKTFVPYAWDKYDQVVVRDYVSGAMENTTAVIHGEMMQHDHRAHLDFTGEDVISHELFHHWFGDLVTCESWSNLTLNESFATYGEYLWREHAYGRQDAEHHMYYNKEAYLQSAAASYQPSIVRYEYADKEDMFDVNSYQRGGAVLNMLRTVVGDTVFFKSLRRYLREHAFGTAEIHDLRLAFEKEYGEDLNWFFNQWFLQTGHPVVDFKTGYNDSLHLVTVEVNQVQSDHVFRFPITIKLHGRGYQTSHPVWITEASSTFTLPAATRPYWIQTDADHTLLCNRIEELTAEERKYQLAHAGNYYEKHEALDALKDLLNGNEGEKEAATNMINYALNDDFWAIRHKGLESLMEADDLATIQVFESKVADLATTDSKAAVRLKAVQVLARLNDAKHTPVFRQAVADSSYQVCSAGLDALYSYDSVAVLSTAGQWFAGSNLRLCQMAFGFLARAGNGSYAAKVLQLLPHLNLSQRFAITNDMAAWLSRTTDTAEAAKMCEAFQAEYNRRGVHSYYPPIVRARLVQCKENLEEQLRIGKLSSEASAAKQAINHLVETRLATMKIDQALLKLFEK